MKLSVIIPTYNEVSNINATIKALLEHAVEKPYEIIVVDCGSVDGTREVICEPEVVVVFNPRLAGKKWGSLRMGANLAQGEVLLFLDADTIVPKHYDAAIAKALNDEKVVGGAFEFSFDKTSFSLSVVSIVNRLRYRFRKRFYGDQGIFVRKKTYEEAGGWPGRSLLEAPYLCKNLQQFGRLEILPQPVKTSSRRFIEGGVWKVFFHDFKIWGMDFLGMDVEKYGRAYWQKNKENVSKQETFLQDMEEKAEAV